MRTFVLSTMICAFTFAQERQTSTSVWDLNGHRVDWTQARSGDGRSSETLRNLNGRNVPLEQVQERVVRNEGGVRVVERITKKYDLNGNPLPPEKAVTETTTRSDGSSTEQVTLYRGDINGSLKPAERSITESRKSGDVTTSQTTRERPSINGGFDAYERRSATVTETRTSKESDELVYLRDANGNFNEAARRVIRAKTTGNETQEQVDEYESATTGSLRLSRQSAGRITKNPDGTERKEVDVFGPAAPGRAIPDGGAMQLRERQFYASRQSPDGSTVQVFSVQRPSLTSTKELGPVQRISETVCKGKCQ